MNGFEIKYTKIVFVVRNMVYPNKGKYLNSEIKKVERFFQRFYFERSRFDFLKTFNIQLASVSEYY